MPVSQATEAKLRAAMNRLLDGQPLHTDGALTKENLAREARLSHATVHRADAVLAEWNARTHHPHHTDTAASKAGTDMIADLRRKLREANQRARMLQGKLDALATVTANLHHENCQLKKKLAPKPTLQIAALDG
jgi:hypothetical protein